MSRTSPSPSPSPPGTNATPACLPAARALRRAQHIIERQHLRIEQLEFALAQTTLARLAIDAPSDTAGSRVLANLSPREKLVAALIVQGKRNRQIAAVISTTEQVVKNYARCIYNETGMDGRAELIAFVMAHPVLRVGLQQVAKEKADEETP